MNAITMDHTNRSTVSLRVPEKQPVIALQRGAILRLDGDSRGRSVECRRGRLWISQKGDASDYLLSAGNSMTIGTDGLVVIEALEESELALDPRHEAGPMAA